MLLAFCKNDFGDKAPGDPWRMEDSMRASLLAGSFAVVVSFQELWSADRDVSRFPALEVRNPLVG